MIAFASISNRSTKREVPPVLGSKRSWTRRTFAVCHAALVFSFLLSSATISTAVAQEDEEIPEPEAVTLETRDGVQLRCTWYPGMAEKESIPIIMLHGWDGSKDELAHLAVEMQKLGHSIIVPDLRGHGGSVNVKGSNVEIDREKMNKAQIALITNDIEACKKFLVEKNDEGKLNIDMLVVVAAEESCIIAAEWAIADWSFPDLGGRRQGRDVKALVFLSPTRRFKGLTMVAAMRNPLFTGRGVRPFSLVIAAGSEDREARREAMTIHSALEKTRPELDLDDKTEEERNRIIAEQQDLFLWTYEVDYQGTDLVHPRAPLGLTRNIGNFVYYRLAAKEGDFPWAVRKRD